MKKLLYFMLLVTVLASCSSGNGTEIVDKNKTYAVNFVVSAGALEPEEENNGSYGTKSGTTSQFLQYVVYSASNGAVILNKGIDTDDFGKQNIVLEDVLPEGRYYLSVLVGSGSYEMHKDKTYEASNLETDICYGNYAVGNGAHNKGMYYSLRSFAVNPVAAKQSVAIGLEPMWSIAQVYVNDKQTCILPENTKKIKLTWEPHTFGFKIKNKKGVFLGDGLVGESPIYSVEEFRKIEFLTSPILAQSDKSILKFTYLTDEDVVIEEKIITEREWVTGVIIDFTGNVRDGFAISLGPLDPVERPFDDEE